MVLLRSLLTEFFPLAMGAVKTDSEAKRMRGALLLMLANVAAVGCLFPQRPSVTTIVKSLTPPTPVEGVIVDSVLIEQPVADGFLDHDLWADACPIATASPEVRTLLDQNGLRSGVISGAGPQKFQTLLGSDTDTVSPLRTTFQVRKDTVIPTATPGDVCKFRLRTDVAGKPLPVELKQARCGIHIRPQLMADGRVKVWCEPHIQHGERQQWLRPNEDATRFSKHDEVPVEKYPALGFEVLLEADDYLLLGWDSDAAETIGSVLFTADANGQPRQRVLVIRARSATPLAPQDLPPIVGAAKRPSAAAQAASRK